MTRYFPLFFLLIIAGCNFDNRKKALKLNDLGIKYLQERKEPEAIASFLAAAKMTGISKNDKTLFIRNTAISYLEEQKKDSAKYYYQVAADLNDKYSYNYLVNIADVCLLNSQVKKAIDCLEQAIDLDDSKVAVNNLLGLIYIGEHGDEYLDAKKALKYNLKAYNISPGRNTKFVLMKNYYILKEYKKADELITELYRDFPFADYLMSAINVKKDEGEKEQAAILLNELKQKFPEDYKDYIKTDADEDQQTGTK